MEALIIIGLVFFGGLAIIAAIVGTRSRRESQTPDEKNAEIFHELQWLNERRAAKLKEGKKNGKS